jgi:hypothetical protein
MNIVAILEQHKRAIAEEIRDQLLRDAGLDADSFNRNAPSWSYLLGLAMIATSVYAATQDRAKSKAK